MIKLNVIEGLIQMKCLFCDIYVSKHMYYISIQQIAKLKKKLKI